MIKVSIVTASFNSERTIGETFSSLAEQTYPNIEHVLIDGGSSDSTVPIAKEQGNRIVKLVSEPDFGIYDAMNKGIRLASGGIVGTLNADDVYADSHVLEKVADVFSDPTVDVCYGDLVYVSPGDVNKVLRVWKASDYSQGLFLRGWVPPHPTFFVRRSVYEQHGGFDLDFPLAADFELMLRFLHCLRLKAVYIPHTLVKMRLGGATNKNIKNIFNQNVEIYRAGRKNNVPLGMRYFAGKLYDRVKQHLRAKCA